MDDHDPPYSQYNITTVGELIDEAFGDPRTNTVHHKMVQVILYILANHLRLLQRKVYVNLPIDLADLDQTESTLLVTEVSLHANIGEYDTNQDAKKSGLEKIDTHWKPESEKKDERRGPVLEKKDERERSESEKEEERGRSELEKKDESWKSETKKKVERRPSEVEKKDEGWISDTEQKDGRRRSELEKKDKSEKSELEREDGHRRSGSDKKDELWKTALEKKDERSKFESEQKDKRWESELGKKDERMRSELEKKDERWKTELESKDGRWKSELEKHERRKSESKETHDEKPEKRTSVPRQPDAPVVQIDKTTRIPGLPPGYSIVPDNLKYTINAKVYFAMTGNIFKKAMKKTHSYDDQRKPPVPIKSLDSVGTAKYGKMLIVERVSTGEAKIQAARQRSGARRSDSSISIVTQEQFQKLTALVRQIQRAFGAIHDKPQFLENMQLMQELRRGASLTDAMSGLQLSARLEETEKTIGNILPIVTEMAIQFGIDIEGDEDMQLLFGKADGKIQPGKKALHEKQSELSKQTNKSLKGKSDDITNISMTLEPLQPTQLKSQAQEKLSPDVNEPLQNGVTDAELETATHELYNEIMKTITTSTTRSSNNAQDALKTVTTISQKLSLLPNVDDPMEDLENIFKEYADKINYLDTYLAKEMTANQEELTLMEHYVENGIEAMTEMLAATSNCDPALIAALNNHFNDLQSDLENAQIKQNLQKTIQNNYSNDLKSLKTQLEQLTSIKASRDEVAEAFEEKVGIGKLNGLASLQQFSAVRGDLEKRIADSYDKFNNQEITWQKLLDDCEKNLNDKVDIRQLNHLMEQVGYHTTCLKAQVKYISDILGVYKEPEYARPLYREGPCLSCSNPFIDMKKHGDSKSSKSEKEQAAGAGAKKSKRSDHGQKCIPGHPVPHPIDPRARTCRRWCGGSHTKISNIARAPPGVLITNLSRKPTKEMGPDGKMYVVDDEHKPCSQCQFGRDITPASSVDLQGEQNNTSDNHTEMNIQPTSHLTAKSTADSTSHDNHYQEEIDEKEGIEDH